MEISLNLTPEEALYIADVVDRELGESCFVGVKSCDVCSMRRKISGVLWLFWFIVVGGIIGFLLENSSF